MAPILDRELPVLKAMRCVLFAGLAVSSAQSWADNCSDLFLRANPSAQAIDYFDYKTTAEALEMALLPPDRKLQSQMINEMGFDKELLGYIESLRDPKYREKVVASYARANQWIGKLQDPVEREFAAAKPPIDTFTAGNCVFLYTFQNHDKQAHTNLVNALQKLMR